MEKNNIKLLLELNEEEREKFKRNRRWTNEISIKEKDEVN